MEHLLWELLILSASHLKSVLLMAKGSAVANLFNINKNGLKQTAPWSQRGWGLSFKSFSSLHDNLKLFTVQFCHSPIQTHIHTVQCSMCSTFLYVQHISLCDTHTNSHCRHSHQGQFGVQYLSQRHFGMRNRLNCWPFGWWMTHCTSQSQLPNKSSYIGFSDKLDQCPKSGGHWITELLFWKVILSYDCVYSLTELWNSRYTMYEKEGGGGEHLVEGGGGEHLVEGGRGWAGEGLRTSHWKQLNLCRAVLDRIGGCCFKWSLWYFDQSMLQTFH